MLRQSIHVVRSNLVRYKVVSIPSSRNRRRPDMTCNIMIVFMKMNKDLHVLEYLRKSLGTEQQLQLVFEDQATNDFKALFKHVHGTCYL